MDAQRLRALGPEEAHIQLQTLPGIGPFYASLIVLRAVGFPDVPVTDEPLALELMGQLYGLDRPATAADVERLTDPWRPWRTWTTVLLRAAAPLLVSSEEAPRPMRCVELPAPTRCGALRSLPGILMYLTRQPVVCVGEIDPGGSTS